MYTCSNLTRRSWRLMLSPIISAETSTLDNRCRGWAAGGRATVDPFTAHVTLPSHGSSRGSLAPGGATSSSSCSTTSRARHGVHTHTRPHIYRYSRWAGANDNFGIDIMYSMTTTGIIPWAPWCSSGRSYSGCSSLSAMYICYMVVPGFCSDLILMGIFKDFTLVSVSLISSFSNNNDYFPHTIWFRQRVSEQVILQEISCECVISASTV